MDMTTIEKIKKRLRVKSDEADAEVEALVLACMKELEVAGVYGHPCDDPLYMQAVVLYCKAHFGYDEGTDRFREAFESLRNSMALSGDYGEN